MNLEEPIVFVVDDDLSVRRSTARLIHSAGLRVHMFASALEFLSYPSPKGPACMVLDVRMPGLSGMQLQHELNQASIHIPIIFITAHGDIPMAVEAMKSGAAEFLIKPFQAASLLNAIHAALAHDRSMHEARSEITELRERYERLTSRECEVFLLIVSGCLNKQVADEISITERTVKFHRANIMQKMKATSLADLVRMGEKLNIFNQG